MISSLTMSVILMAAIKLDLDVEPWRAINDGVMGGISSSTMKRETHGLRFIGKLSLENNGGFASVRRLVDRDLSDTTGVRLEIRGDGRDYQLRIRLDERYDGIAWRVEFTTSGEWQTVELGFDAFQPVFRGREVHVAGPFNPSMISQVGFMIADGQRGAFQLDIRKIEFVPAPEIRDRDP